MSSSQRTRARAGVAIATGVGIAVLVVLLFPWNLLRGPISDYLSRRLDRPVSIAGDLDVQLGWTPQIQVDDVSIGNLPWSADATMAHIQRMRLRVELLSLLGGTPVLRTVELVEPQLLLEKNTAGAANWLFGERGYIPSARVGTISVDRGTVRYRDPTLRADISVKLQSTPVAGDTHGSLGFSGDGTLRGEPFRIDGQGLGLSSLRKVDDPYQLNLHARAGGTELRFAGSVVPSELERLRGELQLQGKDLSQLNPFVPLPIPWTPPYKLSGQLAHGEDHWWYRKLEGTVGDSDVAGDTEFDLSGTRPLVTADLSSRRFDYKDLGGVLGLPPGESTSGIKSTEQQQVSARRAASPRVLPDKPFDLGRLRAVDADIRFRGTSVTWTDAPIDNLSTHLVLKDGILRFEPIDFGIGGGHVVAKLSFDANDKIARSEGDIELRNVELKRIFPRLAPPKGSAGRFGGHASYKTQGNTLAAMFASANGQGSMIMHGGQASTLTLVMSNLDLARAAMLLLQGDQTSEIRCAVASFGVANGQLVPQLMVIDTSEVTIDVDGGIDFRDEKYDLRLKARSKKPSLIALRGPIVVGGTFKTPVVHPQTGQVTARLGTSAGLAALAPPLALLALVDFGGAPDIDCRALFANAKSLPDTPDAKAAKPVRSSVASSAR
jgi:AsmA family protein